MSTDLQRVREIAVGEIEAARSRIAGAILRTPLVRLDLGVSGPDIRLKLENLQPTNSYKIRGALNAVAVLSEAERALGVWTISAGNAGQAVAYAARAAGVKCTVVAFDTAPAAKLDRIRTIGADLIVAPYDEAWRALEARRFRDLSGVFLHPFDDDDFIAGHGSMALEILEDASDTTAIIAAVGGGGLITALGSVTKTLRPDIKVWSAEPETAAPAALSFAMGTPQVFSKYRASFVDGAGGRSLFPRMWERMKPLVDGNVAVSLDQTRRAVRLLAEKSRVVSEGAGALPLAAALTGAAGEGPIVCIVSGGNIDLSVLGDILKADA